jgi:hypothetical protein
MDEMVGAHLGDVLYCWYRLGAIRVARVLANSILHRVLENIRMRLRLWVIVTVAVFGAAVFMLWPRGVKAVVRNAGDATMRDVRVVVTGRSYALGDIRPNEVRSVRVNPAGESGIAIEYTDETGTLKNVRADCYLEAGYSGNIRLDVAGGVVTGKTDGTRATPL